VAELCKDLHRQCASGRNPVMRASTGYLHAVVVEDNYTRETGRRARLTRQGRFRHVSRRGPLVVDPPLARGMRHTYRPRYTYIALPIALRVLHCRMLHCIARLSIFWPGHDVRQARQGRAGRVFVRVGERERGRGKRTARVDRSKRLAARTRPGGVKGTPAPAASARGQGCRRQAGCADLRV
jgi:hypothetical protein